MKRLRTIIRQHWLIIIILAFASWLRFYQIENQVLFEYDEQYNVQLVYNLLINGKISLVGQEMSFGGMFLGPWHYLFLVPFLWMTKLHPIGAYYAEATIGLIAIGSYYWIGQKLFNRNVGLLAAFFRSITFSGLAIDRAVSPAYPSELVALWFIYLLIRFYQGHQVSVIFLSLLFGLMFTVHLSILPLAVVWLIVAVWKRPIKLTPKISALSLLAFIIPVTPQLLFEIRHQFSHLLRLLNTLASDGHQSYDLIQRLVYNIYFHLGNFWGFFTYQWDFWWLGIIIFAAINYLLITKVKLFDHPGISFIFYLTLAINILYYWIYPRHVPEYYFIASLPLIILFTSAILIYIWRYPFGKILTVLFISLVIYQNDYIFSPQTSRFNNGATLGHKDSIVKSIVNNQPNDQDYSVSYIMERGREFGFQYLFKYYGHPPVNEIKPPIYSIVLPKRQVNPQELNSTGGEIGVIYPKDN